MKDTDKPAVSSHPDYPMEKMRLDNTITAINQAIPELQNEGFKINAWDTDVDIRSKQMVTSYRRRKAEALRQVVTNPYFGRVDFTEDGINQEETFYLGRVGFNGPESVQVVDWRAPKASVFYSSQGGRARYAVRSEVYYGEISLKRQFSISDGQLENFFDNQILDTLTTELPNKEQTITDQILRARLYQSTDNKLKDIVETIRAEQNNVIREPLEQVTVVQGSAGSGKSTIALHRVSYLLYNHKSLEPQKVAVIAPNRLFLDYISGVLPGLELEEIKQFTFDELTKNILDFDFELIEDPVQAAPGPKQGVDSASYNALAQIAQFKGSLDFCRLLENMIASQARVLSDTFQDIRLFDAQLVITKEEQANKFYEGNNPYNRRLDSLKKYVEFRLNYFLDISDLPIGGLQTPGAGRKDVKGHVQRVKDNYANQLYIAAKLEDNAGKPRKRELNEQLSKELENIQTQKEQFLRDFSAQLANLEVLSTYIRAIEAWLQENFPESTALAARLLSDRGQPNRVAGKIARGDLAPLCYLKYLLDGLNTKYQHIVVDEAQDLSLCEFAVLRLLSRKSFTILGDLAQSVAEFRGIENWQVIMQEVFSGLPAKYIELTQSYRSTQEIVEFANRVIPPGLPRGVPVYRRGEPPKIEKTGSAEQTAGLSLEIIKSYLKQGCKSIAVICKYPSDAATAYSLLKKVWNEEPLHLIDANSTTYEGGISVIPIPLAKGLEFDAVIVWDASSSRFQSTALDAKLLYVALSRPLHYLHVFFMGELTHLLQA